MCIFTEVLEEEDSREQLIQLSGKIERSVTGIITVGSDSDEVSELEDIEDIGEVGDRFSCFADDPVVKISSTSFSTVQRGE